MSTKLPKISIVTPSYNQAEFLEQTILSVLNQDYPNFEYIIIDGGSTDGSREIIKKYEKHLAYWVSEKDRGQTDAIQKGFRKSDGEIMAYINSDDTYLPGAFSMVVEVFQKKPQADLVYGNIYIIDEQDHQIDAPRLTKLNFENFIFEDVSLDQPATFWKRDIHEQVGGFDSNFNFSMDLDFFIRVAKKGNMAYLPEYIANFRIHGASKTVSSNEGKEGKGEVWKAENKKIRDRYLSPGTSKYYLILMKNLCRLQRIFNYLFQGDAKYVLKKVFNRIRGKTYKDEIDAAYSRIKSGHRINF